VRTSESGGSCHRLRPREIQDLMIATSPSRLLSPDEVLTRLRATAPLPGMVLPDYAGFSTCNVSQLILENFGLANRCPDALTPLLDRRYGRVLLLIMDAMGWNLIERWGDELPSLRRVLRKSRMVPLTVTFPSTTTVALTAIYTGLTPAEHTVTGHYIYLRELGAVMDVLRFSPAGDPRREVYAERGQDVHQFFPMTTVFEPLREAGLEGLSITRGIFTNTALGWLHHVGADVLGYLSGADMFVHLRDALRNTTRQGLVAVYWDVVDMLSHEYGPFSDAVRAAVDQMFYAFEREVLEQLTPKERSDTLLLITADHGQCDAYPDEAVLLCEEPRLQDLLMLPPTGQSRAAYLYATQGDADALGEELSRHSERFLVRSRRQAMEEGLFGAPSTAHRIRHRVGDYVAIGKGGAQLLGMETMRHQLSIKGRHGSLSEDEMLVPLIAMPLDAW
jgi:hypothetical protein